MTSFESRNVERGPAVAKSLASKDVEVDAAGSPVNPDGFKWEGAARLTRCPA
jgi:hypothetical protein